MRILLLSTYFKPDLASTGVLMTQLAQDLAGLGHKLTAITSFPHYDTNGIWEEYQGKLLQHDREGALDVYRIYVYVPRRKELLLARLFNYASFNALSSLLGLLVARSDVILAPSPPLTIGLSAYLISRVKRVPYIYNVQDIYPDVAVRLGVLTNPRLIRLFRHLEDFVYRNAAAVTVLSQGFCRNLLAKGVPEDKIHIIPNFVDTEFIRPLSRHNGFSSTHGLDNKFVILFAGNVGFSQGLETVLETAQQLTRLQDLCFLLVGNGAAKQELVSCAEHLRLRNVCFLPFQPHKALPEMYASSDICLVPLRKGVSAVSVPSKVFTILAAGKPLIASVDEDSDTWRLVQEADCGICVEPENPTAMVKAIEVLYRDRELRERMGVAGRRHVVARFTRKAVAHQYAELLTQVVGKSGGVVPVTRS